MQQTHVDILLVEDNPHEAKLAIKALSKSNLTNNLAHVFDGEEALDFIFARGKYEDRKDQSYLKIILLDLKLPKVDGHEVVKELKSNPLTKAIPIVILTSSNQEKDIKAVYENGANSFIVKPVGFENFSKVVADLGMYWMLMNQTPPTVG